jgi:hypothetical protein
VVLGIAGGPVEVVDGYIGEELTLVHHVGNDPR